MNLNKYSKLQLDALSEVGNIGSNKAADSLGNIVGKKIEIFIPRARIINITNICEIMGGSDKVVTALYVPATGDLQADLLIMGEKEHVLPLIDSLLDRKLGETKVFGDEEQSAFKESANIMAGAYFSGVSDFLKIKFIQGLSHLAVDMAGAITDFIAAKLAESSEEAFLIETEMNLLKESKVFMFLILPPKSTQTLVKAAEKILT